MRPSLATLLSVVVLAVMAPAASADSFVDTTPGSMAFAVPAGVSSLSVSATGGAGGDVTNGSATLVAGGRGALVTGTVAVFAGEQLQLTVATNGGNANGNGTSGGAGAPDGGAGGSSAGGGGGATRVLACQGVVCPVAVIAAGGGGAGANGFVNISSPPSFATLPGGPGGTSGARGSDGSSDTPISGGGGGQPGTAGAGGTGGTGGSGPAAGDNGSPWSGPAGGAGGNQTNSFNQHEGGGGGGGGVFGAGGGGSGASGQDASLNQAYAGGGGGGGGSSLAPSGGTVSTGAPGAAPGIVLTWTPPAGTGSGPGSGPAPGGGPGSSGGGSSGGVVVAAVSGETLSPSAFPAAPSGPSALAAKRRYGTKVSYTLNEAASVNFTVLQSQPGRKAKGGRCVKPTKANRKARKCMRLVALPSSFTRAGSAGANSFRFTGRLAGHKLKPGKYQLIATPIAGAKTGRTASASFQIIN